MEIKLTEDVITSIETAQAKALATSSEDGVHVVPVSTVRVQDNKIILVNYFMGKTLSNILENSKIALSCWSDLQGVQIKAVTTHETEGVLFEGIQKWVAEILPDRVVKGILVLTPLEVYDISATATKPGAQIV